MEIFLEETMDNVPEPRVAILIPAWNQIDELRQCLESFSCDNYTNYEVIVVNNGTDDNTSEVIRRDYSWVTLIEEGFNLGFCKANNIGLRYCSKKNFEYVVLLNADTKVLPGFIGGLVRIMREDPKIGIAGAKNLLMDNPSFMWGQYGKVTWGPMLSKIVGRFEPDRNLNEPPRDVDWVICNGCIISRAALEAVGEFDENFWQCDEDIDLSYRAREAGFRIIYADSVAILHKGSSSTDSGRKKIFSYGYFLGRNAIMFAKKHATLIQMIKLIIMMAIGTVVRFAYFSIIIMKDGLIGAIIMDKFFLRGIYDGLHGKLSPDYIMIHRPDSPATTNAPEQGRWVRFKRWMGAA